MAVMHLLLAVTSDVKVIGLGASTNLLRKRFSHGLRKNRNRESRSFRAEETETTARSMLGVKMIVMK